MKPKLPVEGDGFVFGEEIDVLALEFLDEQFYHAGRYTLVTQQNTATSEQSAPGAEEWASSAAELKSLLAALW
ncbi:MAG: hypothetical protein OSB73_23790, partial [Candidatus Latescibacteria bacterium]|nr:hypothetical protein [Candidatus Latescibacterota bacterium]